MIIILKYLLNYDVDYLYINFIYTEYPRIKVFPLNDRFVRSFGDNFSSAKMSKYQ